jgi:hypothetical protein
MLPHSGRQHPRAGPEQILPRTSGVHLGPNHQGTLVSSLQFQPSPTTEAARASQIEQVGESLDQAARIGSQTLTAVEQMLQPVVGRVRPQACSRLALVSVGVPPTQVAEWAGHSVNVLLRVYAQVLDGREEDAKSRIARALELGSEIVTPAKTSRRIPGGQP